MRAFSIVKTPHTVLLLIGCLLTFSFHTNAQKRGLPAKIKSKIQSAKRAAPVTAIVIDERLAILRFEPSLAAIPLQRMRMGRTLQIIGERESDGIKFYRVQLPPELTGWVQSEAVVSSQKTGDDARLARLVGASQGFDQIERGAIFLDKFPASEFRPAILLLVGDLLEEQAVRMTRDANRRLDQNEMQAGGAPVYSYFMSYSGLDRFRRIGANFVFDRAKKQFHYDGAAWREIARKYPNSQESREAAKRLQTSAAASVNN